MPNFCKLANSGLLNALRVVSAVIVMVMIDGLHNRADNLISTTVKNAERLQCVCQNPLSFYADARN